VSESRAAADALNSSGEGVEGLEPDKSARAEPTAVEGAEAESGTTSLEVTASGVADELSGVGSEETTITFTVFSFGRESTAEESTSTLGGDIFAGGDAEDWFTAEEEEEVTVGEDMAEKLQTQHRNTSMRKK